MIKNLVRLLMLLRKPLSTVAEPVPPKTVTNRYKQLQTVTYHLLHKPLQTVTNRYKPLQTVTNHLLRKPLQNVTLSV